MHAHAQAQAQAHARAHAHAHASVLRQAPLVHVGGRAQWRPLSFLAQQLPLPGNGKAMGPQGAEAREREFVKQLNAELGREIQAASVQVGWFFHGVAASSTQGHRL